MNLTFIIYGHDRARGCDAVRVVRPLSPLDARGRGELVRLIGRLQPVGSTPIALALRTAGRELANAQALSGVILISDGKEMCGGDPAAEAAALAPRLAPGFGVQVVGFGVKADERQSLEAIAQAGEGQYLDAPTTGALRASIQRVAGGSRGVRSRRPRPASGRCSTAGTWRAGRVSGPTGTCGTGASSARSREQDRFQYLSVHRREYGDFELRFRVRLTSGNSGVQIP